MESPHAITLFARGLFSAGKELSKSIISGRTVNGMIYSLLRYPFSPIFRNVATPRPGIPFDNGACMVYNRGYSVSLYGVEGLPPYDTHRFAHIYERLVADGTLSPEAVFVPEPVTEDELRRVHTEEYVAALADPAKMAAALEFPLVARLPRFAIDRILAAYRLPTGGTVLAARLAMEHGLAVNLGGGFHHARPYGGAGFCLIADIPIAIEKIRQENGPLRVLVVDLDVHQGDGTIVCTAAEDDIYTFSMHQSEIYPFPKEDGDLDVELQSGTADTEYLDLLETHLRMAFEKSRPELVFYVAGADPLKGDPLASIELSVDGLIRRDAMVSDACRRQGVPLVVTLGGGYGRLAWQAQYKSIKRMLRS